MKTSILVTSLSLLCAVSFTTASLLGLGARAETAGQKIDKTTNKVEHSAKHAGKSVSKTAKTTTQKSKTVVKKAKKRTTKRHSD